MKDDDIVFEHDLERMMLGRTVIYLKHILDETLFLKNESKKNKFNEFITDELRKRAFVRSFQVISETVKHIPDGIRKKYPFIEWQEIGIMHNIMVHKAYGVDYELIWDVVVNEIPNIVTDIKRVIDSETGQG